MVEHYDENGDAIKPRVMYMGTMFVRAYFTEETSRDGLVAHVLDHDVSREFALGEKNFDTGSLFPLRCEECCYGLDPKQCTQVFAHVSLMRGDAKNWYEKARKELGLGQTAVPVQA